MNVDWTIMGPFLGVGVAAIARSMFDSWRSTVSARRIDQMMAKRVEPGFTE
jgi:hypothetical protein